MFFCLHRKHDQLPNWILMSSVKLTISLFFRQLERQETLWHLMYHCLLSSPLYCLTSPLNTFMFFTPSLSVFEAGLSAAWGRIISHLAKIKLPWLILMFNSPLGNGCRWRSSAPLPSLTVGVIYRGWEEADEGGVPTCPMHWFTQLNYGCANIYTGKSTLKKRGE